jgi:hypothetical protein
LPDVPAAPTAATPSTGVAEISWTKLVDDDVHTHTGGTLLIGYYVEAYLNGTATGIKCFADANSDNCSISGLNGSLTYTFKVTASNVVGSSTSDPSGDVRPGTFQTIKTGNMHYNESLAMPVSSNDRTVKHGQIPIEDASTATSGLQTYISLSPSSIHQEDTAGAWSTGRYVCEISDGKIYFDLAGTCNILVSQDGTDSGNGGAPTAYLEAASVGQIYTVEAVEPSAVIGLTLIGANMQVSATWGYSTDDGGAPITGYQLTWYQSATDKPTEEVLNASQSSDYANYGRIQYDGSIHNAVLNGLINGTTYTFEIQSKNRVGVGPIK